MIKIAASVLSSDFLNLEQDICKFNSTKIDWFHLDIMDGNFVPNISFGSEIVKSIRSKTNKILDTHLMIANPEKYIAQFAKAGSDFITFHLEATNHAHRCIQLIKSYGIKAGIALNPATHESNIDYLLEEIDLILVMTVNPGFGGQKFINSQLSKIKNIKAKLSKQQILSVDGGINLNSGKKSVDSGANTLVSGSFLFNSQHIDKDIKAMQNF